MVLWEFFYTWRGCICSFSVFHSLHVKDGLFLKGPFKKGNNICMQSDQLMPEVWGIAQKIIMKRDSSDTYKSF